MTQIFYGVNTTFEIGCMVTNVTIHTWQQQKMTKNKSLSSSENGSLVYFFIRQMEKEIIVIILNGRSFFQYVFLEPKFCTYSSWQIERNYQRIM